MGNTEEAKRQWLLFGRILFTLALIATISFVFSNSMQIAEESSGTSQHVLQIIQDAVTALGAPGLAEEITEHFVRKLAHICEYMLVGFWLMLCLRVYTKHFFRHITWPMFGALFIALIDETIQLFSEGRSASVSDIWIDFFGAMLGLLIGLFILCLWRMCWILYENRDR